MTIWVDACFNNTVQDLQSINHCIGTMSQYETIIKTSVLNIILQMVKLQSKINFSKKIAVKIVR